MNRKLSLVILFLMAALLAGCGNYVVDDGGGVFSPEVTASGAYQNEQDKPVLNETAVNQENNYVLLELGETIVTAMSFWEEWWYMRGRFSFEHVFDDWLEGSIYQRLLPTSGFESMADIRDYLMRFYTESMVDSILHSNFPPFVEYDGLLYIHAARAGFTRTYWETAIHTFAEQDVVHTSALRSAWHKFPNLTFDGDRYEFLKEAQEQICQGQSYFDTDTFAEDVIIEVWYRFTFRDGKIKSITGWGFDEDLRWNIFGR